MKAQYTVTASPHLDSAIFSPPTLSIRLQYFLRVGLEQSSNMLSRFYEGFIQVNRYA